MNFLCITGRIGVRWFEVQNISKLGAEMNSLANFLRFLGLATYLCVVAEQAASQEERSVENPPEYLLTPGPEMRVGSLASAAVDGPRDFSLENEVSLEMNIEMIERRIYNPDSAPRRGVGGRGRR